MAMSIKNEAVEKLVKEVVLMTGETKTEAIRRALQERRERLNEHSDYQARHRRLLHFLESELWPSIPEKQLGRGISKEEREKILGYGPEGY